ncbi:antibiotic biosynthesis monooxygenase [Mangrovimicrobium sediminis]|uniref:Antibiotic biosynthesis monooxygenase n=1 Tax=Mangrovimicrobium sediminis TaxID=2562682 RepID=A0A4Z0LWK0_9GAMM|nr:antibiotic biosynthesis monooxygenase [Haliea sp. SAOS-164]TGD71783.1 antibiotic biosynthesis monooxygenase [Haliea sp. SAOS-164]
MHFIFEVKMRPGYPPERYAEAWLRASEIIQQAPGALGTRLHRKIGHPDTLLAIATWESKAARDAMESRPLDTVQRIIAEQSEFVEITVLGEYTAPEWQVIPPD